MSDYLRGKEEEKKGMGRPHSGKLLPAPGSVERKDLRKEGLTATLSLHEDALSPALALCPVLRLSPASHTCRIQTQTQTLKVERIRLNRDQVWVLNFTIREAVNPNNHKGLSPLYIGVMMGRWSHCPLRRLKKGLDTGAQTNRP